MKKTLTEKELLEYCNKNFHYNPDTGQFWRKLKTISKLILPDKTNGYYDVRIYEHLYKVHRLIWLMIYGYSPLFIDHINCVRDDNRLINLRECTRQENNQNISTRNDSISGYKGVSWSSERKIWQAYINNQYIGQFTDKNEAAKAYNKKAIELFGEFAKLNIIKE